MARKKDKKTQKDKKAAKDKKTQAAQAGSAAAETTLPPAAGRRPKKGS